MDLKWCRKLYVVKVCLIRLFIEFQGNTGQNIANFDPNWALPDCNSSLNSPDEIEMMHNAWHSIEEIPIVYSNGQKINEYSNTKLVSTIVTTFFVDKYVGFF